MTPAPTAAVPSDSPSVREIAELIGRLRQLTTAGPDADPAERAAFLANKDDLIERITNADRTDRGTDTAGAER
jgi:hypothetical protein